MSIQEKLIEKGVPEKSVTITEGESFNTIYIRSNELGYASIRVYQTAAKAKATWKNIEDEYYNLEYIDDNTAVGNVKEVMDASIEEWICLRGRVIVYVEQYVASDWYIYIGEDGEEYYGDGTKVSDVTPIDVQRAQARELESIILDCINW